jgi:Protein of unknown function (DUF3822)
VSNIYSAYQHQSASFQPEKLKEYRLRVVSRPEVLLYAVLSASDQILAVKEYRSKVPLAFPEFFDEAYSQDYFLKEDYCSIEMVNSSLEFSLVPTVFFKPQQVKELAGALIKENTDLDHLEYLEMASTGATAIYTVPFPMKQKCDHFFQNLHYQPFCQLMVNLGLELSKQSPSSLLLHIMEKQFVITAFKEGNLHLCNAYDYESVLDMVYFLQLVMEILKLDVSQTKIYLSGDFEEESELTRQLKKYVPRVEIPKKEFQKRFQTKGDQLPIWKYAYLAW